MGDSSELVNVRRLLEAQVNTYFAVAAGSALVANVAEDFDCSGLTAIDTAAINVPDGGVRLWRALGVITTGASAPVEIGWQLFEAAGGVGAITPYITTRLEPTSLTSGEITAKIDMPFRRRTSLGTTGHIFIRVTSNVNVDTFQPWLFFVTDHARTLVQPVVP